MSDELPVSSGSAGLVDRAKAIIMTPKEEWPKVAAETSEPIKVLTGYAIPLMLIAPICSVLGSFLAANGLGLTYYVSLAILSFVLGIAQLYALSFIANLLSTNFGGKDSFPSAFKLVAHSWTPLWLFGVFGLLFGIVPTLVPILGLLGYVAIAYGVYLFYLGAGPVMGVSQDKAVVYTIIYAVAAIVLYIIVLAIAAAIVVSFILSAATPAVILYQ